MQYRDASVECTSLSKNRAMFGSQKESILEDKKNQLCWDKKRTILFLKKIYNGSS